MDALIVVDVQNDFCLGGALEVTDGDAVVEPTNRLAAELPFVVATRDWHPPDHLSFSTEGGPWPIHCVQDTPGAQFHPQLVTDQIDVVVDTGYTRELEGYSAFEGTNLDQLLRDHDVSRVHVVGLALDYCVRATALDARAAGFDVVLHRDATRAVEVKSGDGDRALQELEAAGVSIEG